MTTFAKELESDKLEYLKLLSKTFRNIQETSTEIINLQAILSLPKGMEHFMSDIHGEADAFLHIMNNCSGTIRNKIETIFAGRLSKEEMSELSTLIYYPTRKMKLVLDKFSSKVEIDEWYEVTLHQLIEICRSASTKYTRSKVRKALPSDFAYVIDELINANLSTKDKAAYYDRIFQSIIDIGQAPQFITALCDVIKRLTIDSLHIVGDIFDRGEHPEIIIETLMNHHDVDLQWGNHDCLWMGAAAGSGACIANVLNNAMKYNLLDVLEDAYSINLLPLASFANATYEADPTYYPKGESKSKYNVHSLDLIAKMRKAIVVIMFKMEGKLIKRRPEFGMNDRLLLDKIDYENKTITFAGKTWHMEDTDFKTIDKNDVYTLSKEEGQVMEQLIHTFKSSPKLQEHIKFLYKIGSSYKVVNGNLLYHGCVPLNDDGSFEEFTFDGKKYSGKALYDYCDIVARQGYYATPDSKEKKFGEDFLWWLWCGKDSPIFGKKIITTFERVFVKDEDSWEEPKNAYYKYRDDEEIANKILEEFGLKDAPHAHIVNGHVPVETKKGQSPIKANGKILVIDGGFCKYYHHKTGIAGYTMFYNSWGLRLAKHDPFDGVENAIKDNKDIVSTTIVYENMKQRITVADTDMGVKLKKQIYYLELLLDAYKQGKIVETKI